LGYYLSYEEEKDLNMKITNFLKITGIINQNFKPNLVSNIPELKFIRFLLDQLLLMVVNHGLFEVMTEKD
jgi:hypothetical protein